MLIFGDADTRLVPLGERHFYGFTYRTGRRGPDGLTTAEGIGLGSSRADLEAAYGDDLEIFPDDTITGGPRYQIGFEIDSSTYLSGILRRRGRGRGVARRRRRMRPDRVARL